MLWRLKTAGAQLAVLECVPVSVAKTITGSLNIPVIGIGAGNVTDGQILVMHDLLGLTPNAPKFSKKFLAKLAPYPRLSDCMFNKLNKTVPSRTTLI